MLGLLALATLLVACSFDFDRQWPEGGSVPDAAGYPTPPTQPTAPVVQPDATAAIAPLQLCLRLAANTVASCPAGWRAIAGGAACSSSWLNESRPTDDLSGWTAACVDPADLPSTHVICASTGTWTLQAGVPSEYGSTATCPAGQTALGGGCRCAPDSAAIDQARDPGAQQWDCYCEGNGGQTAYTVCADPSTAAVLTPTLNWTDGFGPAVSVGCAAGTLGGGGCSSSGGPLRGARLRDRQSWECTVDGNSEASALALCVNTPIPDCL